MSIFIHITMFHWLQDKKYIEIETKNDYKSTEMMVL